MLQIHCDPLSLSQIQLYLVLNYKCICIVRKAESTVDVAVGDRHESLPNIHKISPLVPFWYGNRLFTSTQVDTMSMTNKLVESSYLN